ncbi:MAG: DUF2490 domain-containing protein [Candidatus Omnitrophota bacterium]|nr:DUF2490 domain-containing protein [Candidatus Omnitrophota bacterium]
MKKQIVLVMALLLIVTAMAYAYDDGDFQVWNTDVEEFKINNNSKIALEEEFRWGDNANEFYYQHYDAGFFYNLEKYLNIGGGYRHIYELKNGKFKQESEPYITATLLWDIKGFKFEDRNRMEYRYFDYQADSSRYRNKITMKLPCNLTKIGIQPYLSDEIFISFGGTNQFNQNRFSSGIGMNLTKNVKAEIYYMLQSAKSSGKWTDINVLGTKLKVAF